MSELLNILVTGYYEQNNLGDDLFVDIGKYIFPKKIFKNNSWPDIFEVTNKITDETRNDPTHPVQTWILLQRD